MDRSCTVEPMARSSYGPYVGTVVMLAVATLVCRLVVETWIEALGWGCCATLAVFMIALPIAGIIMTLRLGDGELTEADAPPRAD